MSGFGDMLISIFVFVIVFGSILFLAYVTTKFVGNKSGRAMKGKYVNIVETVSLGLDSKLHLVKIGEEFVLISASGKNVQLLTKVDMGGYTEEEISGSGNSFDFKEIFEKYIQNFKGKQSTKGDVKSEDSSSNEDKSFRHNLEKLKTITSRVGKYDTKGGDENTNGNQG
ncbi:flagellar biosynthetic protein FliO [Acetivibrio cellulolyticus]|uniref:flagellar biosynthetic protein FliO n=1 Tax=Acetivibrio cellulolyticus TaxID=35830 RepID=UPI0001E2C240|nr:flagellar biosynthetic protein FliO [Acetivibrio cellulolyticus]